MSSLLRQQREASRGFQGDGNESPLVAGTDAAKSWQDARPLLRSGRVGPNVRVALDYASCGASAGLPPSRLLRRGLELGGSCDAGPVISNTRVAPSLRTASGDSHLSPRIATAAS